MKLINWVLSGLLISGIAAGRCESPYLRKEIRELSDDERNRLINAMRKLMEPDPFSNDKLSRFEKFARIHQRANKFAHGKPAFYPWHRIFLRYFEMELQRIDPGVHLAYWDWTYDANNPEKSEIFDFLGKNGNPDEEYRLTDGPFNNTYFDFPSPHYLTRKFDDGQGEDNTISRFASPEQMLVAINDPRFSFFAHLVERFHGDPHMSIGDRPSDFSTMYSPLDPIFYFHHTFIDLVWYRWQMKHPKEDQYEGKRYRQRVSQDDRMSPFLLTAGDALDTESNFFCYTYPDYPRQFNKGGKNSRSITLPSTYTNPILSTFANLTMDDIIAKVAKANKGRAVNPFAKERIKKLKPIRKSWIEEEGLDEEDVRESEEQVAKFTDAINSIPFFQPLAKE